MLWETGPSKLEKGKNFGFFLFPGLSLNRGSLNFDATVADDDSWAELRPLAEDSDWTPKREEGIVIDDLDEGFSVLQPRPSTRRFRPTSVGVWLRPPTPQFEYDGQLAQIGHAYKPVAGRWARTGESSAYGRHRPTIAIARVGNNKVVHPARFSAEIAEAKRWKLEFYVHFPANSSSADFADFKLRVDDGSSSWEVDFDPSMDDIDPKWKTVGEFDLSSGTVYVDVVGGKKRSLIYADAIRWSPIDSDPTPSDAPKS